MAETVQIFEASDCEGALLHLSEQTDLDLVLLDLYLPKKDGFDTLTTIRERYPVMPVAIISGSNQVEDITRALKAGAVGYIPKETTGDIMLGAIHLMLSGGVYIPQFLLDASASEKTEKNRYMLTPRQMEVLKLLSQGQSNKVIASFLLLSEATVKMHVTAIFKALHVSNRTQAALAAEKLSLDN
jgi:DNA-binding NarL/FixJ family response regulator